MLREPAKKTILDDDGNPVEYLLTAHPAGDGLRLAGRLFSLAGGPVGKLFDAAGKGGLRALVDGGAEVDLGGIVKELATAAVAADLGGLMAEMTRFAVRDGKGLDNPAHFNAAFSCNYGELAEVAAWVIEVNGFVRFFKRAAGLVGKSIG